MNTQQDEIAPGTQIGTAIIQMNDFIEKAKIGAETINSSIPNILLSQKMSANDFRVIYRATKDILEIVEKHNECPWYSVSNSAC